MATLKFSSVVSQPRVREITTASVFLATHYAHDRNKGMQLLRKRDVSWIPGRFSRFKAGGADLVYPARPNARERIRKPKILVAATPRRAHMPPALSTCHERARDNTMGSRAP